jgi:hypothetical protein
MAQYKDKAYSYRVHYEKVIDGTWQDFYTDKTYLTKVRTYYDKTSVNTGNFVPGVYRVNPYSVWREVMEGDQYDTMLEKSSHTYRYYRDGAPLALNIGKVRNQSVPSALSALGQQALQKAYAKVSVGDLSMAEDIGEFRETIAMLKNPLGSLKNFLLDDRRKNMKLLKKLLRFQKTGRFGSQRGKEAAKAAANTWLELRYGFRPLINQLGDLIELARTGRSSFDSTKIRNCRAKVTSTSLFNTIKEDMLTIQNTGYKFRYTTDEELTAYASVSYRQVSESSALDNLGLTPRFWPETAWELTRLSFVWDWFVTVGPWIQTLRINPHVQILGNTVGRKVHRTTESDFYEIIMGGYPNTPMGAKSTYQFIRYDRTVDEDLPLTPLFRAGDVIDLFKTIDSVALLFQRIFR